MPNLPTISGPDLQVDLQLGRGSPSGCNAVSVVINGIPSSTDMSAVVAAILKSLQGALGVELVATPASHIH